MTTPTPIIPTDSSGFFAYGHVYGRFREMVEDAVADIDPYPQEKNLVGTVGFRPVFNSPATGGAIRVPDSPRSRAVILREAFYTVKNGVLVDNEGREGVWLATAAGDQPIFWNVGVSLRGDDGTQVLSLSLTLGTDTWVAGETEVWVNLPDLAQTQPGTPTDVALKAAQLSAATAEAAAQEATTAAKVITDNAVALEQALPALQNLKATAQAVAVSQETITQAAAAVNKDRVTVELTRTQIDTIKAALEEVYNQSQAGMALPPRLTETALNATYVPQTELPNLATQEDIAPIAKAEANVAAQVKMAMPTIFTPPPELGLTRLNVPLRAERLPNGRLVTNIDVEDHHIRGGGPTVYVDPVNGVDSITGGRNGQTWETAFKTPNYATRANSSSASEIIVRGGVYPRAAIPSYTGRNNVVIRAEEGTRPIFMCCDVFTSWTLESGNVWKVARSTTIDVMDRGTPDPDGSPARLNKVGSVAEVIDTPGTWYTDNASVWVHLLDGRQADNLVALSMNVATAGPDSNAAGAVSFYFEGIEYWGGRGVNMTVPANATDSRILAKNCAFRFAGATNGISVWGFELAIFDNCVASLAAWDGFNYTENKGRTVQALEINCQGSLNGTSGPGSHNGSTSHQASRVARIGGAYYSNQGANLADVNQSRAWVVGARMGDARDNLRDYYGVNSWLEQCMSTSPIGVSLDALEPSAVVRTRDCVVLGSDAGTPY